MGLRSYLVVLSGLAVVAAAACGGKVAGVGGGGGTGSSSGSGSSSSGGPAGSGSTSGGAEDCSADSSVACANGASGFACSPGSNPENGDPSLSCSTPVNGGREDLYCCFVVFSSSGGSTCAPDDTVTAQCPDPTSYGYVCASGDDPTTYDATLTCSAPAPDPDGVHDDFCCGYDTSGSSSSSSGGPAPAGCSPDATLGCVGGATGYACAFGDNPESQASGLSCSTPAPAAGEDDYCCFSGGSWSTSTCEPDDGLTAVCPDPTSYGYVCASGDDPASYDATLNCSTPVPDADGVHDDFCCTY